MSKKTTVLTLDSFVKNLKFLDVDGYHARFRDTITGDILHYSLEISGYCLSATVKIERDDFTVIYHEDCSGSSIEKMTKILEYAKAKRFDFKSEKIDAMRKALTDHIANS